MLLETKIAHFIMILAVLALFSKLTLDAMILGAIAIYLYQRGEQ